MSTFLSHELLLENWAAPAVSVPGSHADTRTLIKRLTGGKREAWELAKL
jgi:hypothetical protein